MSTTLSTPPVGERAPVAPTLGGRDRRLAGLLLLVALVVRVGLVLATPHLRLANDPADYQRLAVSVAQGHGFGSTVLAKGGGPTAFRPPLYPFVLGVVYRVVGVHVNAARLGQALLGTLTVALLGLLALRLFGRRTALVATAIAAVYPPLLLSGSSLVTESMALPLEIGALLAGVRYHQGDRRTRWPLLAGVLTGLAILDRENYAVLLLPLALLVWTARPRLSRRALATPVLVVAAAAIVVVPWTIRNASVTHSFVPVSDLDGFVFAGVYNDQAANDPRFAAAFRPPIVVPGLRPLFDDPKLDEVGLADALRHRAVVYAKAHPAYAARVLFWNTLGLFDLRGPAFTHTVGSSLGYGPRLDDAELVGWFAVGLVALAGIRSSAVRRTPAALWLTPLVFWATTVVALGTYRYRAPIEPFVVLLAAAALGGRAGPSRAATVAAS